MLSTLLLKNPMTIEPTVVSRASLRACAKWNDRAAKRSLDRKDFKAAKRQQHNAINLRKQARA